MRRLSDVFLNLYASSCVRAPNNELHKHNIKDFRTCCYVEIIRCAYQTPRQGQDACNDRYNLDSYIQDVN